jgi:PKD repeat protein
VAVAATAVSTIAAVAVPALASASTGQQPASQGSKTGPAARPLAAGAPNVTVAPGSVIAGSPVTVAIGGGTVTGGGAITNYSVDFGDGQTANPTGPGKLSHAYSFVGTYTVTVIAHDALANSSLAGTATVTVGTVSAALSVSSASGTFTPTQPFVVTLDASKSAVIFGRTLSYSFSCGVGGPVPQVAGNGAKATCAFTAVGSYVVSVTVNDGFTSATVTQTVTVGTPQGPNLGAFTVTPSATTPLTALADFSKVTLDKNAKTPTFTLAWGDGQQSSYNVKKPTPAPSHTYAGVGKYSVQLTVDDGLGLPTSVQQTTVVVVIGAVPHSGPTPVWRIAGDDRYKTGVKVSQYRWAAITDTAAPANKRPGAVVLATGTNFPDALSGVPFATKQNASLLLTDKALSPEVAAEIKRILPADGSKTVYILGGYNAVSQDVEKHVIALGYKVTRIGGADRYETSLKIAHALGDPAHVVVARGDDPADALSAGPLATDIFATGTGATYTPAAIVLSDKSSFDPATKAYVQSKLGNGLSVIAVGGQAGVAVAQLPGVVTSPVPNAAQIAGQDRWETSQKVADYITSSNPNSPVGVATGYQFADALTGGAYMASVGGPLLLTDPKTAAASTTQAIQQVAGTTNEVDVFGGPNAVAQSIFDAIVTTVHGVAKQF